MLDGFIQILTGLVSAGILGILAGLWSVHKKVNDLHIWHNKEDEDGVKVWYTRNKNMEVTMNKMADILDRMDRRDELNLIMQKHQTDVLERHTQVIDSLVKVCESLARETMTMRTTLGE